MYSKLQLAQGNSGYDLGMNTDFMIKLLIDKKLIQKLDKSLIPNIGNIRPEFAHPDFDPENAYTVPKSTGSEGFIYDKSVITRPMKSRGDFLEAIQNEGSGRTSLLDDALAIAPLFWSSVLSWNTTDEAAIKDAEAEGRVARQAHQNLQLLSRAGRRLGLRHPRPMLEWQCQAGDRSSKNSNLVFVYPEPISELWLDSYYLPVGGKNLEGGAFLDELCSRPGDRGPRNHLYRLPLARVGNRKDIPILSPSIR